MARAKDRRLLEKDRWIKGIPLVLFLIFFALPVFAAPTVESGAEKSSVDSWLRTLRSYYIDEEIELHGHEVELDWSSIESLWNTLHRRYQPFYIFIGVYVSVALAYLVNGALFGVMDLFGLMQQYKIQPKIKVTKKDLVEALNNYVLNYVFVILPLVVVFYPIFTKMGIRYDGPFPTAWELLWQQAVFLVLEDFFQYWGHRMLHIPKLYQYVHKVHHHFQAPFALSGSYAHPIETIYLGMATFLPGLIVQPHMFSFLLWVHLRQFDTALTHCGYELPLNPFFIMGSLYGGTRFHDYHHTSFNYNYASRFTFVDKIFGTYKEPVDAFSKRAKRN